MRVHRQLLLFAALVPALALGGCGSDDGGDAGASKTEQAFLMAMIPHHESAIDMAEMARERGQRREIKRLADDIVQAQDAEIARMEEIYTRLTGDEILPDENAHDDLGLSAEEAGMHHESGASKLKGVREFDRAFIDEMIPHHQGAIRMAHVVAADTNDAELDQLATEIIDAQSREIREMNSWRKRWFGATSPAGGVPSTDQLPPSGEGEHDSH